VRGAVVVMTQLATDLSSVLHPFVVGLVEAGTLPARMGSDQSRLPVKDVLAYKAGRFAAFADDL